jgi:uncharacterized membrane protein
MSLARALAFFAGLLTLDVVVGFFLLVVAGVIAPKGSGPGLTLVLGGLLGAIFVAFAVSAAIYLRMLPTAAVAPAGRWLLGGAFVLALVVLYLAAVLATLVVFNR